ncbi:MAG: HAD family hydrolase [Planctomycetota bacterium]|nr:HAD family hydrolase [Planctomycetota bacterium]
MDEFGSATIIDDSVQLLVLDCFDTLVELDGDNYRLRQGVAAFLKHYGERVGLPMVVLSDAEGPTLLRVLAHTGLTPWFKALYYAPESVAPDANGVLHKRLDHPLRDFHVKPEQALFIGDSKLDAQAAQRYGLGFIRVPGSADRDFTFTRLIKGPSRYRSEEYTTRMLKRYQTPE